ncbi:MAG: hypothetical protein KME42_17575 [Tildeniella nuda ZEHNDER 1965/U140]|jgi:hypothetical protein|nr:hypothetical protein [Tildeniella nuda ZEHNDER 1965/U140]
MIPHSQMIIACNEAFDDSVLHSFTLARINSGTIDGAGALKRVSRENSTYNTL